LHPRAREAVLINVFNQHYEFSMLGHRRVACNTDEKYFVYNGFRWWYNPLRIGILARACTMAFKSFLDLTRISSYTIITGDDKANYRKILEISSAHRLNNNPTQPVRQWKYSKYTKIHHPMFASTKEVKKIQHGGHSMTHGKLISSRMIPYAKVNIDIILTLTVIENLASTPAWSGGCQEPSPLKMCLGQWHLFE
ncbi:unnamed protein product, partial [Trichogramma brassicae]